MRISESGWSEVCGEAVPEAAVYYVQQLLDGVSVKAVARELVDDWWPYGVEWGCLVGYWAAVGGAEVDDVEWPDLCRGFAEKLDSLSERAV